MPVLSEAEGPAPAEAGAVPRRIFSPIARGYDRPALILSLFQYRRWHRFLLSRLDPVLSQASATAGRRQERVSVLDMATGTGALAFDLLDRSGAQVTGADITRPMLLEARRRAEGRRGRVKALQLLQCSAEAPPFAAESFDAVTFAYLLRYVSDVPETLQALARLLRPGGVMASLDFSVPLGVWHPLWRLYTSSVLPAGGRVFSQHWREVGAFLGPSIREFYRRWPEGRLLQAWRDAGFGDMQSRRLSLGGAIVIWGRKAR